MKSDVFPQDKVDESPLETEGCDEEVESGSTIHVLLKKHREVTKAENDNDKNVNEVAVPVVCTQRTPIVSQSVIPVSIDGEGNQVNEYLKRDEETKEGIELSSVTVGKRGGFVAQFQSSIPRMNVMKMIQTVLVGLEEFLSFNQSVMNKSFVRLPAFP
jgi:hypothetical protein